jgi:hypothetical protein
MNDLTADRMGYPMRVHKHHKHKFIHIDNTYDYPERVEVLRHEMIERHGLEIHPREKYWPEHRKAEREETEPFRLSPGCKENIAERKGK